MSVISKLSQQQITSLLQSKQKQLSQPITNWTSQIASDQTELSAWGKVAGAISSLNTAVDAISDPGSFDDRGATSSDESIASATVKRGAPQGRYDLTDIALAQSQSVYSESYASGSDSLGTSAGSLTFTFGSGESETVKVDTADMTLNGLAQAINQASGQVKASLVGGAGGERLVLTGEQTGSDGAFSVSGTGGLSQFSYDPSGGSNTMTAARAARDASLKVNGVPVSSPTNTLDGVIPDGTVTLAGSGSATLDVDVDASKLSGAVSAVISKLGDAVAEIGKETAYKPAESGDDSKGKAGPLLGNYSVSSLGNRLLSDLSGLATSGLSGRDIGITVDKDGSVSFDKSQFESAYASNPTATESLVKQLYQQVHLITDAAVNTAGNGIVDNQKMALNNDIKSLQSQITQQNDFVTMQMQIYAQQFTRLLSAQSSLSIDSDYLSLLNSSGSDSR